MTLIISLRIPDGIVIAGDSLATTVGEFRIGAPITVQCPHCNQTHTANPTLDISLPMTTFAYAQKVFPFMEKYGVGAYGMGQLSGRTIHFAVRELEKQLRAQKVAIESVDQAAEQIGARLRSLLHQELAAAGEDINNAPPQWRPVGLQVVGYNDSEATTVQVQIGRRANRKGYTGPGVTKSGQTSIADALNRLYGKNPAESPQYAVFSLQDAIEYARFLIRTTALHQSFSSRMPSVGGDIDIALVTPFDDFKWIQQKSLLQAMGNQQ